VTDASSHEVVQGISEARRRVIEVRIAHAQRVPLDRLFPR
jgi:hypothetical protein